MQPHRLTAVPRPRPGVNPQDMPPSRLPETVIVGLFALRLAKRLIETLDHYPDRDTDLLWIEDFLAPFPHDYALANISGRRRDEYLTMYPDITSRMRSQPHYPIRFMQLNPDGGVYHDNRGIGQETASEMTDAQRLAIIDFCDAANEWGSVVPIPSHEAERMIELADQRRIANTDHRPSIRESLVAQTESWRWMRDDERYHEERRR